MEVANPFDVVPFGNPQLPATEARAMWQVAPSHSERRRKKKTRRGDGDGDFSDGSPQCKRVKRLTFWLSGDCLKCRYYPNDCSPLFI